MKLHEVKKLADGKIYLKGGYFLQPERVYTTQGQLVWTLNHITDENQPLAEVSIIKSFGGQPDDVIFKISSFDNHPVLSLLYRPLSEKDKLEAFYDWVEKNYRKVVKEGKDPQRSAITMMGNGFYLEEDPRREPSLRTFGIKRLMQDEEIGEASIIGTEGDLWRGIWSIGVNGEKSSSRVSDEGVLYDLKLFGDWVRRHLRHHLGEDLFADARKARALRSQAAKSVVLVRLNRDGKESRMHDARSYFNTEQEAKDHHDRMVVSNPGRYISHALYTGDEEMALRTELHSGRFGKVTHARRPS